MTNDYEKSFIEASDVYKKAKQKYEEMISSERYIEIVSTMPFEFLSAKQLCEKLSLYEKLEVKPRIVIGNYEEAVLFYSNLVHFKEKSAKLLEDASFMVNIGKLADDINDFAKKSPYLGPNYYINPNEKVISIARECVREIPQYPKRLTKAFRLKFIESAIFFLPVSDVCKLATVNHIIKPDDLDNISLTETQNNYQEKIKSLCKEFGRELPVTESFSLKLKGVTFNDRVTGESRQTILHELQDFLAINPDSPISLEARPYMYTPEIGTPEHALAITWKGKELGNIAADVMAKITDNYENPQYSVKFENVYGGADGMNVGCSVVLSIFAQEKVKKNDSVKEL